MSVLSACRVNDVLGVTYGDTPTERVVRVLGKRDLDLEPLSRKSLARRPSVPRGQYLVTCQATNGQIRSFYSGREETARKIPPLRAAFLYLSGKLPRRKSAIA